MAAVAISSVMDFGPDTGSDSPDLHLATLQSKSITAKFAKTTVKDAKKSLWICGHILLHGEIIEHIEVGIQILVFLQRLQISHRRARFRRGLRSSRRQG